MNNRRDDKLPVWVGWIGDMSTMNQYLFDKEWASRWLFVKTFNTILRSIGNVAFTNNPISGMLILIAMLMSNTNVALACLLAGFVSVVTNKLLNATDMEMRDGVCVFNSILLGTIVTAVAPDLIGYQLKTSFWVLLALAIFLGCYIDQGLNAIMAPCKLPGLSLPFNIAAAILFLSLKGHVDRNGGVVPLAEEIDISSMVMNITGELEMGSLLMNRTEEEIEMSPVMREDIGDGVVWSQVMRGSVLAAGQIYGVGTMDSSIVVWLAFILFSPILAFNMYVGSVIGCIGGAFISAAPYTDVYLGLWGYNALLTSGGISYFLVPSGQVFMAGIAGALLAMGTQAACTPIFTATMVPVFSYPFNVATLLILAISTKKSTNLNNVCDKTFPELHLYEHYFLNRSRYIDNTIEDGLNREPLNDKQ